MSNYFKCPSCGKRRSVADEFRSCGNPSCYDNIESVDDEPRARPVAQVALQACLFDVPTEIESEYTAKIGAPLYRPKNKRPDILTLVDTSKPCALVKAIDASGVSEAEKVFLRLAAQRHNVFNYHLIADYYSHATPEAQRLIEQSALVIVDFGSAIENGYVEFNKAIKELYEKENR